MKDRARSSETLNVLSDGAERLFWRLVLCADDYGRFEAVAEVVLCQAFPLRIGRMRPARVRKLYGELEDAFLVITYEASDGRRYGQFVRWDEHNRRRNLHSKFPAPPRALLLQAQKAAAKFDQALREARGGKPGHARGCATTESKETEAQERARVEKIMAELRRNLGGSR